MSSNLVVYPETAAPHLKEPLPLSILLDSNQNISSKRLAEYASPHCQNIEIRDSICSDNRSA